MPTYQYACTDCGHELEAVQSFTDDALTVCPDCGGTLRKLFGNVGVVFKGSGFYRTDSRSGSGGATDSTGTGKESSGAGKDSTGAGKDSTGAGKDSTSSGTDSSVKKDTASPSKASTPNSSPSSPASPA